MRSKTMGEVRRLNRQWREHQEVLRAQAVENVGRPTPPACRWGSPNSKMADCRQRDHEWRARVDAEYARLSRA